MTDEKTYVQKKVKEQQDSDVKAERERKRVLKAARKNRRKLRLAALKNAGFRPNHRLSKDKKTGQNLKGYFSPGSSDKSSHWNKDSPVEDV